MKKHTKILIVSPIFPYPLETGGHKAQFLILDKMSKDFEITLLYPKASVKNKNKLQHIWPNVDIRVLDLVEEKLKKEPLLKRIINRLKYYYFHPLAGIKKLLGIRKTIELSTVPKRQDMVFSNSNITHVDENFLLLLDKVIKEKKFDIIQIEFLNFVSLGYILPKNVKKVFVHHEIGFVRMKREIDTLIMKTIYEDFLLTIEKRFELDALNQFDEIVVFSDVDQDILNKYLPEKNIHNSPFSVEISDDSMPNKDFKLEKVLFIGSENHYPNYDGLIWLLSSLENYEAERSLLPIKIQITGNWSQRFRERFEQEGRVEFLGFVDDLQVTLKNSIMIVPLRIGSGIRTKILEAFSWGVPVLSTTIGIEGIPAIDGEHYMKTDSIEEFIEAINTILVNPKEGLRLAENAKNEIIHQYDLDECYKKRKVIYEN